MDRIRIKETAKELLKKNHWLCVGVAFLSTLTLGGVTFSSLGSSSTTTDTSSFDFQYNFDSFDFPEGIGLLLLLIIFAISLAVTIATTLFVTNQFKVGSCRFFLKYRKNHPVKVDEIFQSYRDKTFLNVAKVTFFRDLEIFLWTLLCFIPGIIKAYEYAAVNYILCVNPSMNYKDALNISKRIMNGHKMELFELSISFLGWHILSIFTCGLLSIFYVNPYCVLAEAEFFSYVREDAIMRGVITPYEFPDYDEYVPQPPAYTYYNPNFVTQQQYTTTPVAEPIAEPVAEPEQEVVTEETNE